MKIKTHSGTVSGSKRSRYMQWLAGRVAAGAWTGAATVRDAWANAEADVTAARTLHEAYTIGYVQAKAYDLGRQHGIAEVNGERMTAVDYDRIKA